MRTEAEKRGNAKYKKENTIRLTFRLYKNTDSDIIEYLNGVDNRQGYIKQLIREDMKKKDE